MTEDAHRTLTYREARDQFADMLTRAEYRGEVTIITRRGNPVAAVVPLDRIKDTDQPPKES
jgi:prevent-host-death family protein